jgi:hypothetical protein
MLAGISAVARRGEHRFIRSMNIDRSNFGGDIPCMFAWETFGIIIAFARAGQEGQWYIFWFATNEPWLCIMNACGRWSTDRSPLRPARHP